MNKFFSTLCVLGASLCLHAKEPAPQKSLQQTLSIIKPDAVDADKIGHIVARIEEEGMHVVAMKMVELKKEDASRFYVEHKERPFYNGLVAYMTSGPVIALVVEGENAVDNYRKLMGATDPRKASPGTIRGDFGTNIERNAVHGSDSLENAKKEIAFFFAGDQIYPRIK